MRVESLHIYPVKGMKGCDVGEAAVRPEGFAGDRRWMLVDANGRFISQREQPRLALIAVLPGSGGLLTFRAPGMPDLFAPPPQSGETLPVTLWRDSLIGYPAAAEANAWFSQFLGMACRLVYQGETVRPVDPRWSQPGDVTSFADAYPLLVCTTSSLADLGRRLGESLPMDRFRPSIVVADDEPWAEDEWASIRIGAVRLDLTKPCARCSVTTVDQAQGLRMGKEPLRTLATFRFLQVPGISGVIFGQNAIPRSLGRIAVGDDVTIVERQQRPAFKQATLAEVL
jgi:uncharacterized protein YcbX